MKKVLTILAILILSTLITFITFEAMSWYHFPDIPTKIVLIRLIIFFIVTAACLTGISLVIKKHKK